MTVSAQKCDLLINLKVMCFKESNIRDPVLSNVLHVNSLQNRAKELYLFSLTHLMNSIKHELSCKIRCEFAMVWLGSVAEPTN